MALRNHQVAKDIPGWRTIVRRIAARKMPNGVCGKVLRPVPRHKAAPLPGCGNIAAHPYRRVSAQTDEHGVSRGGPATRKPYDLLLYLRAMLRPIARIGLSVCAAAILTGCRTIRTDSSPREKLLLDGIPPIVQTNPGYCVPATVARAMAFEGGTVPQSHLALLGGCSADGGVDVEQLYATLSPIFSENGFRLREWIPVDLDRSIGIARRYNEKARSLGAFPLPVPEGDSCGAVDLAHLFGPAKPELLREAAAPTLPRFHRLVRDRLRSGHPLLWGVVLGIVPEPTATPLVRGGHLRLIVGHDPRTGTILYSDSWAPDCIVKSMPEADAWAITMSLHTLERVHACAPRAEKH